MKIVYLSSAHLVPVEHYAELLAYDKVFIEQHGHYIKQTYRNRCTIAGPSGGLTLSVPTIKSDTLKCSMKDIRIPDRGNWRYLYWNIIESAYNSTPFFGYYKDDSHPSHEKKYESLIDFDEEPCRMVCELIDIHPTMERTSEYEMEFAPGEFDFRGAIHPKKGFREVGTGLIPQPCCQAFEPKLGFPSNLSTVDLLFNMGPESLSVLGK